MFWHCLSIAPGIVDCDRRRKDSGKQEKRSRYLQHGIIGLVSFPLGFISFVFLFTDYKPLQRPNKQRHHDRVKARHTYCYIPTEPPTILLSPLVD
jgi:hypothetical protein